MTSQQLAVNIVAMLSRYDELEFSAHIRNSSAHWYVIYTHALQEQRAENNLRMWGVPTFNPKLKDHCANATAQGPAFAVKSLFPGYIFAYFDADSMLHKICFTRGVRKVISANGAPVPVAEEIIDFLKSRVEKDGFVRIGQKLSSGDEVVVVKGPLSDIVGIFEKDLNESDRVVVLLTAVNYQSRVIVERELIRKVS